MRPGRVLVLIHEYPPIGGGGGRVARDVAQGLARRGWEVRVLTAHWGDLPRETVQNGVRIYRLPSWRREPYRADLRAMAAFVVTSLLAALRLVRRWRPDVVHVHFAVPTGVVAWALRRLVGLPYVLTAHLGDVPGGAPEKTDRWFRWVKPFTPPIWRAAARVVAVSTFTRDLALRHYDVPIQVIPNGVVLPPEDALDLRPHSPPRILFAGRLVPQKDPLTWVAALAQVRDEPWRATLLGDGPLMPAVRRALHEAGLTDRVHLAGWVDPDAVDEAMATSDILFMPSRSEGMPMVGVQGLAWGLALVVSRVGGFVDLVRPGENGVLVPPGDVAGFARALRAYLRDPDALARARAASRAHARNFELDRVVQQYEAVLRAAMGV